MKYILTYTTTTSGYLTQKSVVLDNKKSLKILSDSLLKNKYTIISIKKEGTKNGKKAKNHKCK